MYHNCIFSWILINSCVFKCTVVCVYISGQLAADHHQELPVLEVQVTSSQVKGCDLNLPHRKFLIMVSRKSLLLISNKLQISQMFLHLGRTLSEACKVFTLGRIWLGAVKFLKFQDSAQHKLQISTIGKKNATTHSHTSLLFTHLLHYATSLKHTISKPIFFETVCSIWAAQFTNTLLIVLPPLLQPSCNNKHSC
jgi:hypothetical protein